MTLRILGIDPGMAACGWGVIDKDGPRLSYVARGVIRTKRASAMDGNEAARCREVVDELVAIVNDCGVDEVALEDFEYQGRHVNTSSLMTRLEGRILGRLEGLGYPVAKYGQRECKRALGAKTKAGVKRALPLVLAKYPAGRVANHATDALAVAVCHANLREVTW